MTRALAIGSLFSGYLGLDLGVRSVFPGAREAWVSDVDKGANKILAHRAPDAPNLGDITAIGWAAVEPVDIITGGSPCQDLSMAGRRAGMAAGTRSGLWESMREAIAVLKPRLVVWENVRGALSASAASELEHCPGCMGGAGHARPPLRALGRVLGDLADLGFDAEWHGLRVSDLGGCHGRWRVFVVAWPANSDLAGLQGLAGAEGAPSPERHGHPVAGAGRPGLTLLPTPGASDPTTYRLQGDTQSSRSLPAMAGRGELGGLLPTPTTEPKRWGDYAAAIASHERMLGRPAPAPTEPGAKGRPRLSVRFVEWMMGLPDGWVADVPGLTRNEALKALGNGVVPIQAAHALRVMLNRIDGRSAA